MLKGPVLSGAGARPAEAQGLTGQNRFWAGPGANWLGLGLTKVEQAPIAHSQEGSGGQDLLGKHCKARGLSGTCSHSCPSPLSLQKHQPKPLWRHLRFTCTRCCWRLFLPLWHLPIDSSLCREQSFITPSCFLRAYTFPNSNFTKVSSGMM